MANKPKCVWVLFVDEIRFSPKFSFIGIRDRFETNTLPWKPEVLNVVTFWRGEPGTRFEFALRVTGPGGVALNVPSNRGLAQIKELGSFEAMVLNDITFPQFGTYNFSVVSDDGIMLISEPFDVVKK